MSDSAEPKAKFPRTFWTANTIEIFERAAYYAMASFMVIYLNENLGMKPTQATFLNGTLLWGLLYFLPIISGTLADKFGYRRALCAAFVMISLGYALVGYVQSYWPGIIGAQAGTAVDYFAPIVLGIILIGIGGSIVKPCIAGTVQKTAGARAVTAFGIFYMMINIGSIIGRLTCYQIRQDFVSKILWSLGKFLGLHRETVFQPAVHTVDAVFKYASTGFALVGLVIVLALYREPRYAAEGPAAAPAAPKRTVGQALLGIFTVLGNLRFVFFLIVLSLFWFLYIQLYNMMPLFMRFVDRNAPMELYTLANPIMIVSFQMLFTRLSKKWTAVKSIMVGVAVTTAGMAMNILPPLLGGDIKRQIDLGLLVLPFAGIFLIVSIASMAAGEMLASPRIYEYLGSIAPKGQEGLFMGYANLPIAAASMIGGPIGGALFEKFISAPAAAGRAIQPAAMWLIIAGIGVVSLAGLAVYDAWLKKAARAA